MKLEMTIFPLGFRLKRSERVGADIYDEFHIFVTTSIELEKHKQFFMLAFEWQTLFISIFFLSLSLFFFRLRHRDPPWHKCKNKSVCVFVSGVYYKFINRKLTQKNTYLFIG